MEGKSQQPVRRCVTCLAPLPDANPRRRFCSPPCKAEGWRREHANTGDRTIIPRKRPAAPPPNLVRDCPHCGEPVAIVTILATPQVARPDTPASTR